MPVEVTRFEGGRRLFLGGAVLALVGLVLFILGLLLDLRQALFSYLVAYAFGVSILLGALIFLTTAYVMKARWHVAVRRVPEAMVAALPLAGVLVIPILAGIPELYLWAAPPEGLDHHTEHLLHHKAPYLNTPFFIVRTVIYFGVWIVFAHLLRGWSMQQDADGDVRWTLKMRRLSAGAIPAIALAVTFAAYDWLMSLTPEWFSSIFGVYFFAAGFQACFAVIIIALWRLELAGVLKGLVTRWHYHAFGKLLFGFTVFWAYIAFSQYFIIWIANLPEEVSWFVPRTTGGWTWLSVTIVVGRFVVPFALLLSRKIKFLPERMSLVAGWVIFFHFIDMYWLVMPTLHPEGMVPHWLDVAALALVTGALVAFVAWRARGVSVVPSRDPALAISLRYHGQ